MALSQNAPSTQLPFPSERAQCAGGLLEKRLVQVHASRREDGVAFSGLYLSNPNSNMFVAVSGGACTKGGLAAFCNRSIAVIRPGPGSITSARRQRSLHQSADFLDTLSNPDHKDTYYSRTALDHQSLFPALHSSKEVDCVIIGGGLAGVNTAHALAQRGKSVVCLEAGKIGWAASGRNGGFAHPGWSLGMGDLVAKVGLNHTRALWNLTFDSVEMIKTRVKKWEAENRTSVPASIQPGMLTCSWFNDSKATREDVDFGNEVLGRDYFQYWSKEKVREHYSTDKYYDAVMDPDSFHFHSLNYALEVARDAKVLHGASIHEKTAATRVELLGARGERKRVHTSTGATVTAQHLIIAGSAYLPSSLDGAGIEHVRRALLPVMTYACVTEPLGEAKMKEIIRAPHAVTGKCLALEILAARVW
jgi:gamma-glutamylputrescine oxidase